MIRVQTRYKNRLDHLVCWLRIKRDRVQVHEVFDNDFSFPAGLLVNLLRLLDQYDMRHTFWYRVYDDFPGGMMLAVGCPELGEEAVPEADGIELEGSTNDFPGCVPYPVMSKKDLELLADSIKLIADHGSPPCVGILIYAARRAHPGCTWSVTEALVDPEWDPESGDDPSDHALVVMPVVSSDDPRDDSDKRDQ